jgi:hypothetical protein
MDPKHPMLIAMGDIEAEDYVLMTLKKTRARLILKSLKSITNSFIFNFYFLKRN